MKSLIQLKQPRSRSGLLILLLVTSFAPSPMAQAVMPAPDGGYPGGNTAEGQAALLSLTGGTYNTAVGFLSLRSNTEGQFNTAIGAGTLLANQGNPTAGEGIENTASGAGALLSNATGAFNSAHGAFALFSNTIGNYNTAIGESALFRSTEGDQNTACGTQALLSNTTGAGNTATGAFALFSNTAGGGNTAIGTEALFDNTTGVQNTAVGVGALGQNTTGIFNTALGLAAGFNVTTANNVICIGDEGANMDNSCYIGNIYGASIDPTTTLTVGMDASHRLGTAVSSERFKRDIQPMGKASEAIMALRPVIFHYKSDSKNTPCFGLVAEHVAEVNPHLVISDKEGKPYAVRYDQVNAMLLNEFLKEHRTVQEQGGTIARLEKQVEALTAGLQKVSAQLEASKPAPHVVNNP